MRREKFDKVKKITKQKEFTQKQIYLIEIMNNIFRECKKSGLVFEGKGRNLICYRKINYDYANSAHGNIHSIYHGSESLKNIIIKDYGTYKDSGADDELYFPVQKDIGE